MFYNKYRHRRFCIICGTEISGTRRIKTCENENCIHEYKLLHYKEALQDKTCKKCGKTFKGTFKQCLCEDVVSYHYEHPEIGIVVCPKCHHKLDKQYRRLTYYQKKQ